MAKSATAHERILFGLALVVCLALTVSGMNPYDRGTWWMEVVPALIAVPLLDATYRRFPLTGLTCGIIFIQALILIVGGAYTYARACRPVSGWNTRSI